LSWQVVPSALPQMMAQARGAKLDRLIGAVMQMKKFDLDKLTQACTA
jgi:predicted 3-demethylubiquinone-9 3-methyltransferase (glyoxalase superfamily)